MQLNTIFLILSPLFLMVINISPFSFNIYIYYLLTFLILTCFFTQHNIKGWYWLSLFLIFYSLPHLFIYHFYGQNNAVRDDYLNSIINNSDYNLEGIKILSSFIIFLFLGSAFFNIIFRNRLNLIKNDREFENSEINLSNKFLLYLILLILIVASLNSIDFNAIRDQYKLSGFNILFSLCYILNFIILVYFFNENKNKKFIIIFILLYIVILGFLGVRQTIFWLLSSLLLAYLLISYVNNQKVNWSQIIFFLPIVIILFGLVLGYRVNKEVDLSLLSRTIELSFGGILSETSYTYYNFMAVLDHITPNNSENKPDLFFMKNFKDIFYYLIPSEIFPNKYEYIELVQLDIMYNLKPFGTYFYLGELKLGLRYNFLVYIFGILVGFLTEFLLFYVLKKKDRLLAALYVSFIIMALAYPVRGSIGGGVKIFISFNFIMFYLLKYKLIFKNNNSL